MQFIRQRDEEQEKETRQGRSFKTDSAPLDRLIESPRLYEEKKKELEGKSRKRMESGLLYSTFAKTLTL
jgi:hypothetical protein